jgi:transcriptional regulator
MYNPPHFVELRPEEIPRILRAFPLGILVSNSAAGLDAEHLPFDFVGVPGAPQLLQAHVARANPVWKILKDGEPVLVIFRGVDAYVSPNWYPSKHEQHRQVPTWNYQVVHVHGRIRIREDAGFVRNLVARLTATHEAAEPRPWRMEDSDSAYIEKMISAVVGIEVEIDRIVGKSKLSQNKDARDREHAAVELEKRGKTEAAEAMRNAGPGPASG